jgi:hypothetical protein
VRTWKVNSPHGDLANTKNAFDAYVELLIRGDTNRLEALPESAPAARGALAGAAPPPVLVARRPARMLLRAEPPAAESDVFAAAAPIPSAASPLQISIVNGDLKFVREPLIVGHYRSLKLTGSEAATDALLGRAMSRSLEAGLYPSTIGSHQVFLNTRRNPVDPFFLPRPEAVIVAALGEEGMLAAAELTVAVRQATMAYAQRLSEHGATGAFDLAATLIGTGGIGMHVDTAALAIAEAVSDANERLKRSGWPTVAKLQLIEQYLDRATEAHDALKALATAHPQRFKLSPQVAAALGALQRPVRSSYRAAGYDFISVQHRSEPRGEVIEFTLDTQRARSEVRGVATQVRLINELVRVGADNRNRNKQIGRSLFNLLVPIELEPFLSGSSTVLLQLDQATARYPWELLDTQPDGSKSRSKALPWSARTRVLRKLRVAEFRQNPHDTRRDDDVLVIGEPQCDPEKYPRLPGARAPSRRC